LASHAPRLLAITPASTAGFRQQDPYLRRSRRAYGAGAAFAAQLGLGNLRLEARDILDVRDEYGKFDYVIAHGVYSWVPSQVRERLFALCSNLLNENGVAFVSFNTLPGWHFLQYLRDFAALVREQSPELPPEQLFKQIRGLAGLFAAEQPGQQAQGAHLQQLLTRLEKTTDYMLAFDYLSEVTEPASLIDFSAQASRNGMRYLCDANYFESSWSSLPARSRQVIAQLTADPIAREGFADHFSARLFRRALLCPTAATVVGAHTAP
jgi:SAM-dependent methyltransferase